MKIVRIVPLLDFGGVEQRIKHTVFGFNIFSGNSLEIVVLGGKGKISKELQLNGTNPFHLGQEFKIPNLKLIFRLYRFLKDIQPDVVHTSAAEANFHGLMAAKLAGVPVRIGEEIGFPNHDWKWRLIFKWLYKSATKVIAISNAVKNRIVELGEVEEDKVEVVYNPVELGNRAKVKGEKEADFTLCTSVRNKKREAFGNDEAQWIRKRNRKEKQFVFVTICRLVPVKNLDTLIKVFSELVEEYEEKQLNLWIVGDGTEKESLGSLVGNLGIKDTIVFWGSQQDVVPFLEQADAFVLPSYSEGFSISLVEAMLCGLPPIVTNQGGPIEIVEQGKTGLLIDPRNPEDLKEKMVKLLLMSREDRDLIGERAKEAGSKYSVENYVKRLEEVYGMP